MYRIPGEVEEDAVLKGLSAGDLRDMMEVKFVDVDVPTYWVEKVQPILLEEVEDNNHSIYIMDLSRAFASELADYGRSLGFTTRSDRDSIHVSWEV